MFWKKEDKLVKGATENSVSMETKEENPDGTTTLGMALNIPKENMTEEKPREEDSFLNSTIGQMATAPILKKESEVRENVEIKVGSRWQHFKGEIVVVKALARHSETNEVLVIYEHNNELWARPINNFLDNRDFSARTDNATNQKYRFVEIP